MSDNITRPKHYTFGNIEPIDCIEQCDWLLGFCLGNVIKYVFRCQHKNNTLEDLKKARWYLDKVINYMEKSLIENNGKQQKD